MSKARRGELVVPLPVGYLRGPTGEVVLDPDGECLINGGSASTWGFALYLASSDKYEDTILPTGSFAGTP